MRFYNLLDITSTISYTTPLRLVANHYPHKHILVPLLRTKHSTPNHNAINHLGGGRLNIKTNAPNIRHISKSCSHHEIKITDQQMVQCICYFPPHHKHLPLQYACRRHYQLAVIAAKFGNFMPLHLHSLKKI